jgi:nitrate reductase (NAD(P)H)
LKTPSDHTNVYLLISNKTPEDTLLLDRFQKLAIEHKDQFHAWFTVSKSNSNWEYSTGRLDELMIKNHLFDAASKTTGSFLCGPTGLIEKGVKPILTKWGARDGENLFGF